MKSHSIKESLRLIQIEKMVIILKELEHIKEILDFFYGYETTINAKPTPPYESKPIKKNIYHLLEDIAALKKKIQTLQSLHAEMSKDTLDLFLIKYDYIRTQIEDLLGVLDALYHKMQQLFGENLNQYLPYPVLGRRFSNNGIMLYLNNYYREMIKKFSDTYGHQGESQLMLGWNFKTGFKYRIFVNRDIKREGYKEDLYHNYIDLPYWYYELPILLPAITHEVAAIALRKPQSLIEEPFENLKDKLQDFLDDTSNNFVQKVHDIIGYPQYAKELAKEIMCDYIAYRVHKEAYIYAIFHNTIAEKLSKEFLKVLHKHDEKKRQHYEYLKVIPNDWYFNQKKDHTILRLHFLLNLIEDEESTSLQSMRKILNSLMPLEEEVYKGGGFSNIYKYNQPGLYHSYKSVQNYLRQLFVTLKLWYTENKNNLERIPLPSEESSPNFKTLWEERFELQRSSNHEEVRHPSNFRYQIHSKISQLDFFLNERYQQEPNIFLLELAKVRKDFYHEEGIMVQIHNELEKRKLKKEIDTNNHLKKMSIYGIYDWATLEEKKSTINIVEKLQSLLMPKDQEQNLRYFITKQVLLKVAPEIKKDTLLPKSNTFSAIYNVELQKNIDTEKCTNGYKNLKQNIEDIYQLLSSHQERFQIANIFKSLGPKDLTIIIEGSSLEFIFELISALNKMPYQEDGANILRTFTTIGSPFENNNNAPYPFNYPFTLISYLRISNRFTKEKLKTLIESQKENMKYIYEVTGVMDYRIEWKEGINMQSVLSFYDVMIEKKYLTDFQTKIEKKESIFEVQK